MPRRARVAVPGLPLHVIQRGNNRQDCFVDDEDRASYVGWLGDYAYESGCALHAYVLMTNHVHLLVTPTKSGACAHMMKRLAQRYSQYFNRAYRRTGTLWEGRYRSALVQDDAHVLACYRYIELNPVRAGIVATPAEYSWSSHAANADGARSVLLSPHPRYLELGADARERAAAYRELVAEGLGADDSDAIRTATTRNAVIGDRDFQIRLEAELHRRVIPGRPGRPRKRRSHPPGERETGA